jgi:hypothetical protein
LVWKHGAKLLIHKRSDTLRFAAPARTSQKPPLWENYQKQLLVQP